MAMLWFLDAGVDISKKNSKKGAKKRVKYRCSYPKCTNCWYLNDHDKTNKHFFRFPKNVLIQEAWRRVCRVQRSPVPVTFRICEDHFKEDQFTNQSKNRLKQNAVPNEPPKEVPASKKLTNITSTIIKCADNSKKI